MMKNVMKKLLVIPFLFLVTGGFVSCLDDDEPIYYFYDEPARVKSLGESKSVVSTAHGEFFVSDLYSSSSLKVGDLLWSSFTVDMNDQPSADGKTAIGFRYDTVDSAKIAMPASIEEFNVYMEDDYSDSISLAVLYNSYIDTLLFFGFEHERPSTTGYEYELICNPIMEETGQYPTLYIRTRPIANVPLQSSSEKNDKTVFAFNMTDFVNYYKKNFSSTDVIKFNLVYKVGTKANGEDDYRAFKSNPISWGIK